MVRNKHNTLGIIKYPFWRETQKNRQARYACINIEDMNVPKEIEEQAICVQEDIGLVLHRLQETVTA